MRSIVYAGHDFSAYCSAEVVARVANPIVTEALEVPGRAGALLVSGRVPPVDVVVRLFLDAGFCGDVVELAAIRHRLSFWLCAPGGGELVLPDEPGFTYRDALLVDAGAWDRLFSDGSCEVVFTLFDPVAYGDLRIEHALRFDVGGTWRTFPAFELKAASGSYLSVSHPTSGKAIRIDRAFGGGEVVVIDCGGESVTVDGADARDCVALSSDFFCLEPGDCILAASGASGFTCRFHERWV